MLTIKMPLYLEIAEGNFKLLRLCNLPDFLNALELVKEPERRAEFEKILQLNGPVWNDCPEMTIEDMTAKGDEG